MNALVPTYARADMAFVKGDGLYLETAEGDTYLDFGAGIAVASLGHAHPALVKALTDQAGRLWHTSNLYHIPDQERLGQRLVENSFADMAFFANSGAEAMECCFKMARKYHSANGSPERYRIITFEGAFHGRTLATIAAGGQAKHLDGFGPKVDGFDQVPLGDLDAVKKTITDETAAICMEPILGESGILTVPWSFLRDLRALCDEKGLLLIFDEVQTGLGRTGKLFAYEWSGIEPDIMALAKGLGGGFPVGACLATADAAKGLTAGTHGTTFGGNALAMAVGNAVLDVILEPGFLEHVNAMGVRLKQKLARLRDEFPEVIEDIRGEALMLGIKCKPEAQKLIDALYEEKMLAIPAGDNVVRLLPALVVQGEDIDNACERLERACGKVAASLYRCGKSSGMGVRHFIDIGDFETAELRSLLDHARALKKEGADGHNISVPSKTVLALMFDKPSTRTRVSFDVAMRQLGGQTLVLNSGETQLGRGETVADTARVLSRYVDAIMLRTGPHTNVTELADHASIPVINGLTDLSHPCQVMADVMTLEEKMGSIEGRTVAWIGDANNVANSWAHAAARFGFKLRIACPEQLSPSDEMLAWVEKEGGSVEVTRDPREAAKDADTLVTDVWVSMGDTNAAERKSWLAPFQVNEELMGLAAKDAIFMHCLPAHRGDEVTADVIDGPQSVVFDEAENRLHAQKAILAWCFGLA